jgi:Xaa-Pro dipeptidase
MSPYFAVMNEIQTKLQRVSAFLDRHQLDGLLLSHRNNFAWITAGRNNFIPNNSPAGVAAIYVTRDKRVCVTNAIEAPRFRDEELAGTGIEVASFPWHDRPAITRGVKELIGSARVASDGDDFGIGAQSLPGDFAQLRWSLTPEEIARFKEGGRRTSMAIERACHEIKPGMTEHEIAGVLSHYVHAQGLIPVVNLNATDQRVSNFRHPIPTDQKLKRYVMLVICAEFGGLISNTTRFVSFGPLDAETRAKQQAVVNIDTAVNHATKPGRTLGEIFADLTRAYAENGHPDQWKLHHQGGSAGYAGREVFANPSSTVKVVENQAFAWNPSITGVKSEDTVVFTAQGIEPITAMSDTWPKLTGRAGGHTMERADILVR